jgi:threonine aldolase
MISIIDLRSDTVTKPSPGMRAVMAAAEVGDDIFGEDPSVNRLQDRVAEILGKEAALFVPSGSMSNQIAIKIHTRPGDEILCDVNSHILHYENGGPAALSGVMCRTVDGPGGLLDVDHLRGLVRPSTDYMPRSRLICLENTHNRGGGTVYHLDAIQRIAAWGREHGLAMHLDGARLWNAVAATGIAAREWAAPFDTVSVCFSKGLGAPVGSALAGSRAAMEEARWVRKLLGGAMRQAGVLAAAAEYALDHHRDRLVEDHVHAKRLSERLRSIPGIRLVPENPPTNIVFAHLEPRLGTAEALAARLKAAGVLALPTAAQTIRFVTHLDVSNQQIEMACDRIVAIVAAS